MGNLTRSIASRPSWLVEYAQSRWAMHRLATNFDGGPYYETAVDLQAAVRQLVGLEPEQLDRISDRRLQPEGAGGEFAAHDNKPLMLDLVAAVVCAQKPTVIVETGVGRGASSAVILDELRRNGHGKLHSIDFPMLSVNAEQFIGQLVPEELRGSWDLRLGPSRTALPRLLREVGEIQLFVHDSDPTYRNQMFEYKTVWPYLSEGGVIVSNTPWRNLALADFARRVGAEPIFIQRPDCHALGALKAHESFT